MNKKRSCCFFLTVIELLIVGCVLAVILLHFGSKWFDRSQFKLSYAGVIHGEANGTVNFEPCAMGYFAQQHLIALMDGEKTVQLAIPSGARAGRYGLWRTTPAEVESLPWPFFPRDKYRLYVTLSEQGKLYSFGPTTLTAGTITLDETPGTLTRIHGHFEATFHDAEQGDLHVWGSFNFRTEVDRDCSANLPK